MCIFQTASRRHLLCCALSAILFTACPQPAGAAPQRQFLSHTRSLMQQTVTAASWAGYSTQNNGGQVSYSQVGMFFTVPTLKGHDTGIGIWVGLWGKNELAQVGIQALLNPKGQQEDDVIQENYPKPVYMMQGPSPQPGDLMQAYLAIVPDSTHQGILDDFVVVDMTTGVHYYGQYPDPDVFDTFNAACIVENNGGITSHGPLANFGTISIVACAVAQGSAGQGSMAPIGSFPNDQIDMVNNGRTLASTDPLIHGATFNVHYCPNGGCT